MLAFLISGGKPQSFSFTLLFALALIVGATFALRLPSLFEPPWYDDEGIYAAVAHSLLTGGSLYREVLDNRPPGMYWIYASILGFLGYKVLFIKLALALTVVATQIVLFRIGQRIWGPKVGLIGAGMLGFLGSLPLLEGNIANSEPFMALPIATGFLFYLGRRYFLAGVCFAIAVLIKQVAGAELLAAILAIFLFSPRPIRRVALMVAGFALPTLAIVAYLYSQGVLGEFAFVGFGYYLGYLQRGARLPAYFAFVKIALLLGAVLLIWWHYRGPRTDDADKKPLVYLWLVFAIFGALFTGRSYPHYLLQLVPPLSLILAASLGEYWGKEITGLTGGKLLSTVSLTAVTLWLFYVVYIPWPVWANPQKAVGYYQNFAMFASGKKTAQEYNDFFDKRVNRNLAVASFLRRNAQPKDYVLVWGEEPWIYPLSRLRNAARFTVSYFAYEFPRGLDEVADSVRVKRPAYIVRIMAKPLYPKLQGELEANYYQVAVVENATILERGSVGAAQGTLPSSQGSSSAIGEPFLN